MTLEQFLSDSRQVLADFDETRERLHAETGGGPRPGTVALAALGAPGRAGITGSGPSRLASLPGPGHRDLLARYDRAGTAARAELLDQVQYQLYAIILATYRPAPAFRRGHVLGGEALGERIVPGGPTWRRFLDRLGSGCGQMPWPERLSAWARQCPRLDRWDGQQEGTGFLTEDGTLLTARHVVAPAERFFGGATRSGWVRYNRVERANPASEPVIAATAHLDVGRPEPDVARLAQTPDWRALLGASALAAEFGDPPGLALQSAPLDEAELRHRPVAVLGHPASGNAGGSTADVVRVFDDAEAGLKRFMPGHLDGEHPLWHEGGQEWLVHDCSTLGGTSGSCLIDLRTGRVLGIHVSGHARTGNRAVPAWCIPARGETDEHAGPSDS